jgi:hypothetical protein
MYPLFFLYISLLIQPHKQQSNGVKSGDLGVQKNTATTDPPIGESVIEMLYYMSDIMRRGSVMLKVHVFVKHRDVLNVFAC